MDQAIMDNRISKGKPVLLLLCAAFLFSCGKGEPSGAIKARGADAVSGEAGSGPSADTPAIPGSVTIIPSAPTSQTDLQAVFSGSAADLSFIWEVNGEEVDGISGDRLDRTKFKKGDELTVRVAGKDISSAVIVGNAPPSIESVALFPQYIYGGTDVRAEAVGKDPDGDPVSFEYEWIINGQEAFIRENKIGGARFARGDRLTLRVTPYDGAERGKPFTLPEHIVPNAPPRFTSTPPGEFSSMTYVYKAQVVDPDGDDVALALEKAPQGMKMDAEGKIEWEIGQGAKGVYDVAISADDGRGGRTLQEYRIKIESPE